MRIERLQLGILISEIVKSNTFVFFLKYKGMKIDQFSMIRQNLHTVHAKCQVFKNTYIIHGLEQNNVTIPKNCDIFKGDTVIIYGTCDITSIAKIIKKFSNEVEPFSLKGCLFDNNILNSKQAESLAELPSKENLRSQLLGVIQAPMGNLVRTLNTKVASIVYVLKAYSDKKKNIE